MTNGKQGLGQVRATKESTLFSCSGEKMPSFSTELHFSLSSILHLTAFLGTCMSLTLKYHIPCGNTCTEWEWVHDRRDTVTKAAAGVCARVRFNNLRVSWERPSLSGWWKDEDLSVKYKNCSKSSLESMRVAFGHYLQLLWRFGATLSAQLFCILNAI